MKNPDLKRNEEESFISCVYASPDVVEIDPPDTFNKYPEDDIYPLNFAEYGYTIKDSKLEKKLIDLDETMQTCMKCGHGVPMSAKKCPFCGNILRISVPQVPDPEPTLKPEVQQKLEPTPEKKGFFASLIGRFKK